LCDWTGDGRKVIICRLGRHFATFNSGKEQRMHFDKSLRVIVEVYCRCSYQNTERQILHRPFTIWRFKVKSQKRVLV
jgi:hypothetical protein